MEQKTPSTRVTTNGAAMLTLTPFKAVAIINEYHALSDTNDSQASSPSFKTKLESFIADQKRLKKIPYTRDLASVFKLIIDYARCDPRSYDSDRSFGQNYQKNWADLEDRMHADTSRDAIYKTLRKIPGIIDFVKLNDSLSYKSIPEGLRLEHAIAKAQKNSRDADKKKWGFIKAGHPRYTESSVEWPPY